MDTEYWKSSPFGENSIFHPKWEEKEKERNHSQSIHSSPLKISIKYTGDLRLKIQINCVVTINFIVEGEDKRWFGFEHHLTLSSNDKNLTIYNEHFDVDNGWTFRVNIKNSKCNSSIIVIQNGQYKLSFPFDFVDLKNAFNRLDRDNLINLNEKLIKSDDKKCIRVADKELAYLLNDKDLVLGTYANLTGFSRMEDYEKKGYIYKAKFFSQNIWKRHTEGDYKLKPYAFAEGQSSCFSNFIEETALCMGIFVYHFILLNGYHVLILLVDKTDNGCPRFKIIDQIKSREWDDLSNIDAEMLDITIRNYESACDAANRHDINSSINLCCIQRK